MDIKPYYITTKERKPSANDALERLGVTCCQALQPHHGISDNMTRFLRQFLSYTISRHVKSMFKDNDQNLTGVLQGGLLAVFLFIIVIDMSPKDLQEILLVLLIKGTSRTTVEEQFGALHVNPIAKLTT